MGPRGISMYVGMTSVKAEKEESDYLKVMYGLCGVLSILSSLYCVIHLQCVTQRVGSVCTVKALTPCCWRDSTPVTRN